MGLFNRKKNAAKVEALAAKAEEKAAEIKASVDASVKELADAAEEKAAGLKESTEAAVERFADKVEEAVNGDPEAAVEKAAAAVEEKAAEIKETVGAAVVQAGAAVEEKAAEIDKAIESAVDKAAEAAEEAAAPAAEAVEEAVGAAAPAEEPAEGAPSCGNPEGNELTKKEVGTVEHVRMNYHAGYGVYNEWPNGGMTIHSGIGWFHPFGPSEYWGVANIPGNFCEESKQFPLEKFFTEDWMENFETDLFCIYRLADGDIYAWDGMFAVRGLDPHKCIVYNSEYTRQDVLVNVIVGGTGRYEGVRGLMIGTTEGGGKTQVCGKMPDGSPLELPETIMKDLDGWIRFPE